MTTLRTLIREQIALRDRRELQFDAALFADPAWDILLDLALARIEGRAVPVTSACIASRVSWTAALRWIGVLIDAGLIRREPHPRDRRSGLLFITDDGFARLEALFHVEAAKVAA